MYFYYLLFIWELSSVLIIAEKLNKEYFLFTYEYKLQKIKNRRHMAVSLHNMPPIFLIRVR